MEKPIRIQRKRTKGFKLPENTVCVTRGTKWGNPFKVGEHVQTHERAVRLFSLWLDYSGDGGCIKELAKTQLKGKNLACFCPLDEPCHADVLLRIANES